jgi:hypothetical protein
MNIHRHTLLPLLLLAFTACAAAARQQPNQSEDIISRGELEQVGSLSAYDAVQRLRPMFLRDRGAVTLLNASARTRPVVFVDMSEYGEIESLRTLPASRVEQVRFYPGREATTRFGSVYGAGVIQLTMRVE